MNESVDAVCMLCGAMTSVDVRGLDAPFTIRLPGWSRAVLDGDGLTFGAVCPSCSKSTKEAEEAGGGMYAKGTMDEG